MPCRRTQARDRLWTLFEWTWEARVWRAWLLGRAVDEHVPPLQSRVVGKRAKVPAGPAAEGAAKEKADSVLWTRPTRPGLSAGDLEDSRTPFEWITL